MLPRHAAFFAAHRVTPGSPPDRNRRTSQNPHCALCLTNKLVWCASFISRLFFLLAPQASVRPILATDASGMDPLSTTKTRPEGWPLSYTRLQQPPHIYGIIARDARVFYTPLRATRKSASGAGGHRHHHVSVTSCGVCAVTEWRQPRHSLTKQYLQRCDALTSSFPTFRCAQCGANYKATAERRFTTYKRLAF